MVYTKLSFYHGFKILLRADAMTGYVCEFDAYTGKKVFYNGFTSTVTSKWIKNKSTFSSCLFIK